MRAILILILTISIHPLFAQDKGTLQKQLVQILSDYPNQFKNLEDSEKAKKLKFRLSGTIGNGIIMGSNKLYISSSLPVPKSEEEAKTLFQKWVDLIDQVSFNGMKMIGTLCTSSCGDYVIHSKKWAFDSNRADLDSRYLPFKISVEVLNFEGAFAASILIGEID